ncbi:MAG: Gfo/Idh/MocA family oxidoreductase [Clostridia bacterium]|nr:Gfo/Idh/MocA family oxidoreductase [Clostridia bacterium]
MKMGVPGKTVSVGIIGLGCRGFDQTKLLASMPDVSIRVVCDQYADRVEKTLEMLNEVSGGKAPAQGCTNAREVMERSDIEAVIIMTGWETHIDLAVQAMRAGKTPAMEVGGASSVEECFRLIAASRETGKDCMLLENCCYNEEEMTLLHMIREGVFGEVVHCQGGYEHDLRDEIGNGDINRHYRQRHFKNRNGELYPTHELGPIARYLDINYGNRMVSLVSMASKAAGLHEWLAENRADDPRLVQAHINEGDVVTTMIKCARGETILLTHDCTLPRPYSRGGRIQGTKAIWMEDNRSIHVAGKTPQKEEDWSHSWEPDRKYMEEYRTDLWKEYLDFGKRGGHGGMDYLVLRAFIEALQNGTHLPIDVYDAAAWMSVTALSEQSIALGSMPVAVPDFTDGQWLDRKDEAEGPYKLGR